MVMEYDIVRVEGYMRTSIPTFTNLLTKTPLR